MATPDQQRCALVTGGGSGIGRALAAVAAQEGFRVALAGRREALLAAAAAALPGALALPMDLRDPASVDAAFARLERDWGRLDLLVNAAGVARFLSLEQTEEADWEAMIATNLSGTWRVTRRALPLLLASRGMVLNVLSTAARKAYPGSSAYVASKFGQLGLAESLREELRGRGIRVVNLIPGATDSPFWDSIGGEWDRSRMLKPAEVAEAARAALRLPPGALLEEIVIRPAGGDL
jgi:NAD(P)-dependent dehydrogenase (short-subunit alcohol dehydrogenase family)